MDKRVDVDSEADTQERKREPEEKTTEKKTVTEKETTKIPVDYGKGPERAA